jgi:hypothetical protein
MGLQAAKNHGLLNLNCAALITAVTKLGFSMELTSQNLPFTMKFTLNQIHLLAKWKAKM